MFFMFDFFFQMNMATRHFCDGISQATSDYYNFFRTTGANSPPSSIVAAQLNHSSRVILLHEEYARSLLGSVGTQI